MKTKQIRLYAVIAAIIIIFTACSPGISAANPPKVSETPPVSAQSQEPLSPSPEQNTQQAHTEAPSVAINENDLTDSSEPLIVSFIDVGQADSIFIELPNNQTMLIDAGNNADGDDVVEYVEGLGYDTIDYLVGTHPHEDHIGGLDTVIDELNVGSIYMPKVSHTTKTFEDVLVVIRDKGLKVTSARVGVVILEEPGLTISILSPASDEYDDLNNYSAVILITYNNSSFLFTGDAEDIPEDEMLEAGYNLNVDVLKVGHHGSASSSSEAFLEAVTPLYAIISVGAGNSYGHPSQSVIDRLEGENARILRTDLDGTVVISTNGDGSYAVKTSKEQ
ncbi:MAG: MBL fold metallo-hydrolase [Clostridiales bacterium]|nr:MBL fold metallo-hydrolase [Clostridiales bacterium]